MAKYGDMDRILASLKRWQRRYRFAEYADDQISQRWAVKPPGALYEEKLFPVGPAKSTLRSVMVFKPDEIGDVVCSLPALRELKRGLPDAKLYLICQDKVAPLLERTGLFHQISSIQVKMRFLRFPFFSLEKCLRHFDVKEFDLSVYLRTYPIYFSEFLKLPSRAFLHPHDPHLPSRSPYQVPIASWNEPLPHQTLQMLRLVSPLTGKAYSFEDVSYPGFQWTAEDREAISLCFPKKQPKRFGVIHPFAKYEVRRYPIEYWRALIGKLRSEFDLEWVIVGGGENGTIENLPGVLQMQGKLNLTQTAYLLSRAAAFLGTESGPSNLAGALGVPTVTLKGGQSFTAEWAPLGRSLVLRAPVPCSPCHRRACPGYGLVCLTSLTPEKVFPDIAFFLKRALSKGGPGHRETAAEIPLG